MKRLACQIVEFERRHRMTLEHVTEIMQRRDQVFHRFRRIRLQIASPDDTFLSVEVDQNQRPIVVQADLRDDRPLQRHDHGPHANTLEGEAIPGHG